ncbi:MAG: methionine adenosyltransferase domain-containing protein, partial [Bacteroidota bacterium]
GTAKVDLDDVEIANRISEVFDMRPKAIVERFGLKNPIFSPTAAYGHMGRESYIEDVELMPVQIVENDEKKEEIRSKVVKKLEFFTWEKLDYVDSIKGKFGL